MKITNARAHEVNNAILLQGNYFGFRNLYARGAARVYPGRLPWGSGIPSAIAQDICRRFIDFTALHPPLSGGNIGKIPCFNAAGPLFSQSGRG